MKRVWGVAATPFALFLLLSIPAAEPSPEAAPSRRRGFVWNVDTLWRRLEAEFVTARAGGCQGREARGAARLAALSRAIATLDRRTVGPEAAALDSLERDFFALAPAIAACPGRIGEYARTYTRWRDAVKRQSQRWDLTSVAARDRLYRSLYGGRAAIEEAMLQSGDGYPAVLLGTAQPTATPSTVVHGVTIHSGDILVSRGGYPTSALIARGNDYPGNFSHIALVHVDAVTRTASAIEAHIERGVTVSTAADYLAAKKRRVMVLRLRPDLPQLVTDSLLPHQAASLALARATAGHIPYDFAMDYTEPSHLFCSEVASWVYRELGVNLWMGISTISNPGLRRWLASFGVRHFETQEPSDLEYDPQLAVVAEWRDPATLAQDHIDNAVIDAMLEGAERGDRLTYRWYALAPGRVAKAYSWVLEQLGGTGPVPEGMSAAAAMRNSAFSARQRQLAARVAGEAARLARERGYAPPYWTLLELAREAAGASFEAHAIP